MSQTFSLVCDETKQTLWIGQGHGGKMTTFYSGDEKVMNLLEAFLNETAGKPLRLVLDYDDDEEFFEYKEFEIKPGPGVQGHRDNQTERP